jgi:hypothetical protein
MYKFTTKGRMNEKAAYLPYLMLLSCHFLRKYWFAAPEFQSLHQFRLFALVHNNLSIAFDGFEAEPLSEVLILLSRYTNQS